MNHSSKLALLGLSVALAACSTLESDKVDYKGTAKKAPDLIIPPDLSQLTRDTRYSTPGATVTATGSQSAGQTAPAANAAVTPLGDVRLERAGTRRRRVVARTPEELWAPTKAS